MFLFLESNQYIYYDNANKELKKILNAFPIDSKKKQQLWLSESFDDWDRISEFAEKLDSKDIRYHICCMQFAHRNMVSSLIIRVF